MLIDFSISLLSESNIVDLTFKGRKAVCECAINNTFDKDKIKIAHNNEMKRAIIFGNHRFDKLF